MLYLNQDVSWSPVKSRRLKATRGMSFEDILDCPLVDVLAHPGRANQSLLLFDVHGYIWAVPFVSSEKGVFFKTLYPSRKFTRLYKQKRL